MEQVLRGYRHVNDVVFSDGAKRGRPAPRWVSAAAIHALVLVGTIVAPNVSRAEDPPLPVSGPGYIVTVGGYGLFEPTYDGSKRQEITGRPIFGLRTPGAKEWLDLPNDGLEYEFIETDTFRAGLVGNFRYQRDTSTIQPRGFKHFSSVNLSLEGGGFAEFWPAKWLRTRVELRDAVLGAEGLVSDLSADVVTHPFNDRWTLTGGPRLSFADQSYMQSYYGVSASQSTTSGLSAYHAQAGLRSYGAGTSARYKWSDAWTTLGFVEYTRLASEAGNSPVIDDRGSANQFTVGIGAKYSFFANW